MAEQVEIETELTDALVRLAKRMQGDMGGQSAEGYSVAIKNIAEALAWTLSPNQPH